MPRKSLCGAKKTFYVNKKIVSAQDARKRFDKADVIYDQVVSLQFNIQLNLKIWSLVDFFFFYFLIVGVPFAWTSIEFPPLLF